MPKIRPSNAETSQVIIRDFLPNNPENEEEVNQIVRWSVRESMVAISNGSIGSHNFAKAAYDPETGVLLGYGAITHIYSSEVMELGGLVVRKEGRGRGIASKLTKQVVAYALETMNPHQIIAFSNTKSAPIFAKLGGVQVEDAATLPAEVWKVCHSCRFFDEAVERGATCCGRVYDITNIDTDGSH